MEGEGLVIPADGGGVGLGGGSNGSGEWACACAWAGRGQALVGNGAEWRSFDMIGDLWSSAAVVGGWRQSQGQ